MAIENPTSNLFVIDTGSYAGNFERKMCAFITGQVGDCGVGREIALEQASNIKSLAWFEENVYLAPDESEISYKVTIWPSPMEEQSGNAKRPVYNSVAIFLDVLPPQDVLAEMVERAQLFCQNNRIEYKGYRLLTPVFEMAPVETENVVGYQAA